VVWIGVAEANPIRLVHERCARVLDRLGIARERRKYAPHVTIARLERAPDAAVSNWVASHALYESARFRVERIQLYSSVLARGGPKYRVEAELPLTAP
jgi:2'-5' RNA ligase